MSNLMISCSIKGNKKKKKKKNVSNIAQNEMKTEWTSKVVRAPSFRQDKNQIGSDFFYLFFFFIFDFTFGIRMSFIEKTTTTNVCDFSLIFRFLLAFRFNKYKKNLFDWWIIFHDSFVLLFLFAFFFSLSIFFRFLNQQRITSLSFENETIDIFLFLLQSISFGQYEITNRIKSEIIKNTKTRPHSN